MREARSMCLLKPGATLKLKRQTIVLLEDVVDERFPDGEDIVPLSYQNHRAIFCSLKNLRQVREKFPALPAYGIWQLIFESRYAVSQELHALYFDEARKHGQFLLRTERGFVSGQIVDGKVLDVLTDVDLQNAREIKLSPRDLHLPAEPALLPGERVGRERRRKKMTILALMSALTAAALLYATIAYWLDGSRRQYQEKHAALSDELATLEAQRDELAQNRVHRWPDQWNVLYPLARLVSEGIRFRVWGIGFNQPILRARLLADSNTEQVQIPGWMYALPDVEVKRQIDGSVQVSWANTLESRE